MRPEQTGTDTAVEYMELIDRHANARSVVDIDTVFDEVARELGLADDAPARSVTGRSIGFDELRLHDKPVAMEQFSEDIRVVTEMQQNMTLSSDRVVEPGAAVLQRVADHGTEQDFQRNVESLYHPRLKGDNRLTATGLSIGVLLVIVLAYMAWVNDLLNPMLPEGMRHVRPSVEEYIHGQGR